MHVTSPLMSAYKTIFQVYETGTKPIQGLARATQHLLERTLAVIESLLKKNEHY
jgi:hypothetical protein